MLNGRDNVNPRRRTRIRYYWKSLSFLSRFTFIDPHDCEVETWRVSILCTFEQPASVQHRDHWERNVFRKCSLEIRRFGVATQVRPLWQREDFFCKKFEKLCAQELASELDALKTNTRHEIGNVLANLLNKTPENLCKNGLSLRFF